MSAPCPWCGSKEHWAGRVGMCPSRSSQIIIQALNTLLEEGETWEAYACRLRKQIFDAIEKVAP